MNEKEIARHFLTDLMCNKALRLLVVKKWDLEAEHLIWFGSEQQ